MINCWSVTNQAKSIYEQPAISFVVAYPQDINDKLQKHLYFLYKTVWRFDCTVFKLQICLI